MSEEWGPWIEHDGRGCPVKGRYVKIHDEAGSGWEGIAHSGTKRPGDVDCWDWGECERYGAWEFCIIRYRIRKPSGLTILEEIAQGVRQPEDA